MNHNLVNGIVEELRGAITGDYSPRTTMLSQEDYVAVAASRLLRTLKGHPDISCPVISTTIGCPKGTLYGGDCCGCIFGEYDENIGKYGAYRFYCNECGEEVGSGGIIFRERT